MADTLFEAIHDGHPERLAQLTLAHALGRPAEHLLRESLGLGREPVQVLLEQYGGEERGGWRADLHVESKDGVRHRIELKLWAHFTAEQERALNEHQIDLVIVPQVRVERFREHVKDRASVHSWSALAECVDDEATAALLFGADRLNAWPLDSVSAHEADVDMHAFLSGNPRTADWSRIYRFLSTLDARLREREPDLYRAPGGWSKSRAAEYYGYMFSLGPDGRDAAWWVGFERQAGTTHLVAYKNHKSVGCDSLPLHSDEAAEHIIRAARSRVPAVTQL